MGHHQESDEGATAVEYGILAGVLGIVFVAAGPTLWTSMLSLLDTILSQMGIG